MAMSSKEKYTRLAHAGPGTDAGEVLRRYWQPVALTEELDGPRPVKAVQLMGEHLVLFRCSD
ncbi:MAG: hypothetical protein ACKVIK_15090, partial [Rhodospirillales bacterium]